ncbi:unnamed protein product [Protopolystoma xenopodis]|uniref:Uncharacterized protein n=1 Tax=Protopolystoma xenopodis TaxID=117903 RepID=A0A3S5BLE0_9PLAT|nr:unnamed protein product [Protopolystoma xenopodis]
MERQRTMAALFVSGGIYLGTPNTFGLPLPPFQPQLKNMLFNSALTTVDYEATKKCRSEQKLAASPWPSMSMLVICYVTWISLMST